MASENGLPDRQRTIELKAFVERVAERVRQYLGPRADNHEQQDHLRHVADRTRWLYYTELNRESPGLSVIISQHEDALIEACVYSHDIAKWIPRPDLLALVPSAEADLQPQLERMRLTGFQEDLFRLGLRRRYGMEPDGYTPEYDSAHHLISAFIIIADPSLGFDRLDPADQDRLISMIIGHQFGSYFKETLLNLSLQDQAVTTGMLTEASRPDRVSGDLLACAFHDADISDLLFVGSLERRPSREAVFHTGGLVKIMMINFTNLAYQTPHGPRHLEECLTSCQRTVNSACKEFLTRAAVRHGNRWRKDARRFLSVFREKKVAEQIRQTLADEQRPPAERLTSVRGIVHLNARAFLTGREEDE